MEGFVTESHTQAEIVKYWHLIEEAIRAREFWRAGMLALTLAKECFYEYANEKVRT